MDIGLFKYPGGKGFVDQHIITVINNYAKNHNINKYFEPFVGSGRTFYTLLTLSPYISKFIINDKDPAISAIWTACIKNPNKLIYSITNTNICESLFHKYIIDLKYQKDNYTLENSYNIALKKLFVHQHSYLGLGEKSKKPLITSDEWDVSTMSHKINNIYKNSNKILFKKCFNQDCFNFISTCEDGDLIYLDPPSYNHEKSMYKYGLQTYEHNKLAKYLKEIKCGWILSYNDCAEIRNLYNWAHYKTFDIEYHLYKKKYVKKELIISSGEKNLDILDEYNMFS